MSTESRLPSGVSRVLSYSQRSKTIGVTSDQSALVNARTVLNGSISSGSFAEPSLNSSNLLSLYAALIFGAHGDGVTSKNIIMSRINGTPLGRILDDLESNVPQVVDLSGSDRRIKELTDLYYLADEFISTVVSKQMLSSEISINFDQANNEDDAPLTTPFTREWTAAEKVKFPCDGTFIVNCSSDEGTEFTDDDSNTVPLNVPTRVYASTELVVTAGGSATVVFVPSSYAANISYVDKMGAPNSALTLITSSRYRNLNHLEVYASDGIANPEVVQIYDAMSNLFPSPPSSPYNFLELVYELQEHPTFSPDIKRSRLRVWAECAKALCLLLMRSLV